MVPAIQLGLRNTILVPAYNNSHWSHFISNVIQAIHKTIEYCLQRLDMIMTNIKVFMKRVTCRHRVKPIKQCGQTRKCKIKRLQWINDSLSIKYPKMWWGNSSHKFILCFQRIGFKTKSRQIQRYFITCILSSTALHTQTLIEHSKRLSYEQNKQQKRKLIGAYWDVLLKNACV